MGRKLRRWTFPILLFLVLCLASVAVLLYDEGRKALKDILMPYLVMTDVTLGCDKREGKRSEAIYVLGGTRDSLEQKFIKAAALYHGRDEAKVFLLKEPYNMEYSDVLKRTEGYEEWAFRNLSHLGVPSGDIEALSLPIGFWGTLSEAKSIPKIISARGHSRLTLVTSSYHTRRTWDSFTRYAVEQNLNLCISSSHEELYLRDMLQEMLKLVVYEIFLV